MIAKEIRSIDQIKRVLEQARTIAVLGASTKPERPACYVPDYLHAQGYRIIPVNPLHRDERRWGELFRLRLEDVGEDVDIVDVFRHPGFLPQHLPDFLAMAPRPKLVWFQLGIRQDQVAGALVEAGIDVVQDRCTLADHRNLGLGRVRT
jgi:hypothetical protein